MTLPEAVRAIQATCRDRDEVFGIPWHHVQYGYSLVVKTDGSIRIERLIDATGRAVHGLPVEAPGRGAFGSDGT